MIVDHRNKSSSPAPLPLLAKVSSVYMPVSAEVGRHDAPKLALSEKGRREPDGIVEGELYIGRPWLATSHRTFTTKYTYTK